MSRLDWFLIPVAWLGATLLLGSLRWFRAVPLTARLRPTTQPVARARPGRSGFSRHSLAAVLGPLVSSAADRFLTTLGARTDTARHLARVDSSSTVADVRVRQLAWAAASASGAIGLAAALGLPVALAIALVAAAPLLSVLLVEEQLARRSREWQRRLTMELPVVAEQMGMLLGSGMSLGGAVRRLGERTNGVCAAGLAGVALRVRQGIADIEALREWAALADVRALDRLVGVLALNREATDLGDLIAAEARAARAETHRALLEHIDRRGQQVWIPVTVATLVPGVIFMAVPFMDAMRQLTGG
jgi:hypothetical protein